MKSVWIHWLILQKFSAFVYSGENRGLSWVVMLATWGISLVIFLKCSLLYLYHLCSDGHETRCDRTFFRDLVSGFDKVYFPLGGARYLEANLPSF